MDEQWGYVGAKSRQRWLFYAYDRLRKTVVAHVFGERTMATLGRLMSLLSPFDVVIWMTDGWPLYESRLKGKLHVISKRYTQRIERHNLNLRQHLARLGRKSLSFSKSVELHDKVIGHYLNIKHYHCKSFVRCSVPAFISETFFNNAGYNRVVIAIFRSWHKDFKLCRCLRLQQNGI
nr:IS1 protein InsB [Escherichia coli]